MFQRMFGMYFRFKISEYSALAHTEYREGCYHLNDMGGIVEKAALRCNLRSRYGKFQRAQSL